MNFQHFKTLHPRDLLVLLGGYIKSFTLAIDFSALSDDWVRLNTVGGGGLSASNLACSPSPGFSAASNHSRFGEFSVLIIHLFYSVGQAPARWIS